MIRFILTIFFCGLIAPYPQASVMFKFIKNPEFVKSGARILFREGRTKGIGQVTQVNLRKYLMIRRKLLRISLQLRFYAGVPIWIQSRPISPRYTPEDTRISELPSRFRFILPARVVLKTLDVFFQAPGQTLNPRSVEPPLIFSNSLISVVAAVSLPVLLSNDLWYRDVHQMPRVSQRARPWLDFLQCVMSV